MFIRSPYNYNVDLVSLGSALVCRDASRAVQSQKEESDINTIVKRFGLTGELPKNVRIPQYGDFTEINDFHSAMNLVIMANDAFMSMPAEVRERFKNDPELFLEFFQDPKNREEGVKLGLVLPEGKQSPAEPAGGTPPKDTGGKNDGKDTPKVAG